MKRNRSPISKGQSYEELGRFWDTHDLAEYWDKTQPADFEVDILSEEIYYPLDSELAAKIQGIASRQGISPKALLEAWIREKLQETKR